MDPIVVSMVPSFMISELLINWGLQNISSIMLIIGSEKTLLIVFGSILLSAVKMQKIQLFIAVSKLEIFQGF